MVINTKQVNSSETPREASSKKIVHDVLFNFNPDFLDYHLTEIKKFIYRPIHKPFSILIEIECPLYRKIE